MPKTQPMNAAQKPRSVQNPNPEKPANKPQAVMDQVEVRKVENPDLEGPPKKATGLTGHDEPRAVRLPEQAKESPTRLRVVEGWQIKHEGKRNQGGDVLENVSPSQAKQWVEAGWAEEYKEQRQPSKK